jgi:hypothetical protein
MTPVAKARIARYLRAVGYNVTEDYDKIVATRRNSLEWLPGSPPRWWPARVIVDFAEEGIECRAKLSWHVATRGKIFSIWDALYFKREIQGALRAMDGAETRVSDLDAAHRSLARKTLMLHLVAFAVMGFTGLFAALGDLPLPVWGLSLFIVLTLMTAVRAPTPDLARR